MSKETQSQAAKSEERQALEYLARTVAVKEIAKRVKTFKQVKKEYKATLKRELKEYANCLNPENIPFWKEVVKQIDKVKISEIKKLEQ